MLDAVVNEGLPRHPIIEGKRERYEKKMLSKGQIISKKREKLNTISTTHHCMELKLKRARSTC
jgi:hypothetical protein